MNDIEVLERFRNYNKFYKEEDGKLTITIDLDLKTELDKAIENLLKERQSDKERIDKYGGIEELENYILELSRFLGNVSIDSMIGTIKNDYIPTSLIKEKKKEIREKAEMCNSIELLIYAEIDKVLEELLKEAGKNDKD